MIIVFENGPGDPSSNTWLSCLGILQKPRVSNRIISSSQQKLNHKVDVYWSERRNLWMQNNMNTCENIHLYLFISISLFVCLYVTELLRKRNVLAKTFLWWCIPWFHCRWKGNWFWCKSDTSSRVIDTFCVSQLKYFSDLHESLQLSPNSFFLSK